MLAYANTHLDTYSLLDLQRNTTTITTSPHTPTETSQPWSHMWNQPWDQPWNKQVAKGTFTFEGTQEDIVFSLFTRLATGVDTQEFYGGYAYPSHAFALSYKSKHVFAGHHIQRGYYRYFDTIRGLKPTYSSRGIQGMWEINQSLKSKSSDKRELGFALQFEFFEKESSHISFVETWVSLRPEWNFVRNGLSLGYSMQWNKGGYEARLAYQGSMRTKVHDTTQSWNLDYFVGSMLEQLLFLQSIDVDLCMFDVASMGQRTYIAGLQYYLFSNIGCTLSPVRVALSFFHSSPFLLTEDFKYDASPFITRARVDYTYHHHGTLEFFGHILDEREAVEYTHIYASSIGLEVKQNIMKQERYKKRAHTSTKEIEKGKPYSQSPSIIESFNVAVRYAWDISDGAHTFSQSLKIIFIEGFSLQLKADQEWFDEPTKGLDIGYTLFFIEDRWLLPWAKIRFEFNVSHDNYATIDPVKHKLGYRAHIRMMLHPILLVLSFESSYDVLGHSSSGKGLLSFVYTF